MTEIYIDADACPVKDEVLRVADRHGLKVYVVGNTWMRMAEGPRVQRVVVDKGPDAADDWIAERAGAGDVVITADIPLAARCVARKAKVVRPNGKPLDEASISMAVAVRDLHTHLREIGEITRGPAPFTKQDRSRFLDTLETTVRAALAMSPGPASGPAQG
jgi:uncharacterized protein YaiI (UPF0178 family)